MADVKISQLPPATTPLTGAELVPLVQSGTTKRVAGTDLMSSPIAGNLNFTGTGNRITGDFSTATIANRVMFQTSTANSVTVVSALPSGTATQANFNIHNNSDPTNASDLRLLITSSEARLQSGITGTGTYLPMTFYTGGSERVRIDTSGNVGIGTSSPGQRLDLGGGSMTLSGSTGTQQIYLYRFSATNYSSIGTDSSTGGITFTTGTSSPSERMRIDSSGNVGIGTSSPAAKLGIVAAGDGTFNSQVVIAPASGANPAKITFNPSVSSAIAGLSDGSVAFYGNGANTERARIDSSGNLLVGTTVARNILTVTGPNANAPTLGTASGTALFTPAGATYGTMFGSTSGGDGWIQQQRVDITAASYNLWLQPSGGEVYIAGTTDRGAYNLQCNGTGVWGAGAYVNGSDARLKENVQTLTDGLSVVTQLRPVTFQYKADYSKDTAVQPGFIAQELQQAMAGKDYVDGVVQAGPEHLNVAYQSLIPVLTKAIQELNAKVEALTAEIQTLKGN